MPVGYFSGRIVVDSIGKPLRPRNFQSPLRWKAPHPEDIDTIAQKTGIKLSAYEKEKLRIELKEVFGDFIHRSRVFWKA